MAHRLFLGRVLIGFLWLFIVVTAANGSENDNCFSIIVGKSVSTDGHVMVAHNEDDWPPQVVNHQKVPRRTHQPGDKVTFLNGAEVEQPPETWSYIWSEMPGLRFSDSYINEWGVAVYSNACPSREDQPELTEGGISYYLRRLVAERARSAREGVHLAAELVERFGYDASGRTYIIADTTEGWMFCAINGKRWLARRVPDDSVAMISNTYSVHEVELSDTLNFLASPDIIDYAIARGWYQPDTEGAFDFAAAYANPEVAADGRNIGRQWSAYRQVADEPPEYGIRLPFCMTPSKKLHPRDLMSVLRDHYEGTDLYENPESNNPHDQKRTPICRHDTQTSFVIQLRSGMPVDIGVVYWVCLGSPCSSVYFPFHFGVDEFPDGWYTQAEFPDEELYRTNVLSPVSFGTGGAFWNFSRMRNMVEQNHTGWSSAVRSTAEAMEREAFSRQTASETEALAAYHTDRTASLATLRAFSFELYQVALDKLRLTLSSTE